MTDLQDMKIGELRSEAKLLGIKATGSKEELREKIQAKAAENLDAPPTISEPEDVFDAAQKIDETLAKEVTPLKGKTRIDEVIDECNKIFKGRAIAKFNDHNPNCIEFHGGPRQRHDVSLHQPDKTILTFAQRYVSRTSNEHQGSVMHQNTFNPSQLSPEQVDQLRAMLQEGQ